MMPGNRPLLSVKGLTKHFTVREGGRWLRSSTRVVRAVSDVTFDLNAGEALGIVGESGSGKTTLSRLLLRLIEPTRGEIIFGGQDILKYTPREVRTILRPAMRLIFQDPDAVLNPAYPIGVGLRRVLKLNGRTGTEADAAITQQLARLGLGPDFTSKYPDELSGGEKRRVGLCRALLTNPQLIVADEPLSGLDVVLQESVLALLNSERIDRGFAVILVSHDLDRVNQVCDRVLVMHGGTVVEEITLRRSDTPLRDRYLHPYSVILQQARVDTATVMPACLPNTPTDEGIDRIAPTHEGCSFVRQCPLYASLGGPAECRTTVPPLGLVAMEHRVACHFVPPGDKTLTASALRTDNSYAS